MPEAGTEGDVFSALRTSYPTWPFSDILIARRHEQALQKDPRLQQLADQPFNSWRDITTRWIWLVPS